MKFIVFTSHVAPENIEPATLDILPNISFKQCQLNHEMKENGQNPFAIYLRIHLNYYTRRFLNRYSHPRPNIYIIKRKVCI